MRSNDLFDKIKSNINSIEGNTEPNLKRFFSLAAVLLIFMGVVAAAIFLFALRGAEQTLVPEVRGKELAEALLDLQVKELYPRIQLRYSQSSRDRGIILEQEPAAGAIVKAGRRVRLVVSQGVMINRVENFIGRNIDEVRTELQTFVASSGSPLLTLKEPLMFDFSPSPPGTILRQKPEAGTDISGPMSLEFVVSQGPENTLITVPQLTGLSLPAALELIARTGILFEFSLREIREGEQGEMVVYQNPAAGVSVTANTQVNLVVNTPEELARNEIFALFSYTIPRNPYPLPVYLEALLPTGERIRLISVDFPGGNFTVPYRLPVNSVLILSRMNREIFRRDVK